MNYDYNPLVRGVTRPRGWAAGNFLYRIGAQLDEYPAGILFSFFLLSAERLLGLSRGNNNKAYGDMQFAHVDALYNIVFFRPRMSPEAHSLSIFF